MIPCSCSNRTNVNRFYFFLIYFCNCRKGLVIRAPYTSQRVYWRIFSLSLCVCGRGGSTFCYPQNQNEKALYPQNKTKETIHRWPDADGSSAPSCSSDSSAGCRSTGWTLPISSNQPPSPILFKLSSSFILYRQKIRPPCMAHCDVVLSDM